MKKLTRMITNEYGTVTRMAEETGIPVSTIFSMIDRGGINTATVSNALKIAKALDTTIEELAESDKEYPKLTKYEKETLKRVYEYEYTHIARDIDCNVWAYHGKPIKEDNTWVEKKYCDYVNILVIDNDFKFVKCTDKEPWNIQELLENCEVEE